MRYAATARRGSSDFAAGRGDRGCQRGESYAGFSLRRSQDPADLVASRADTRKPFALGDKGRAQRSDQDGRRTQGVRAPRSQARRWVS